MKHFISISKLLIVSVIVMSLVAMPAFGGKPQGPEGPNLDRDDLTIVSGCVVSIHSDDVDGITLCTNTSIEDCSLCDDEDKETILGIAPARYWEACTTLKTEIDENGNTVIAVDELTNLMIQNDELSYVIQPGTEPYEKEYVTIYAYEKEEDEDALVAYYVWLEREAVTTVVLLRDQKTLAPLWKKDKD